MLSQVWVLNLGQWGSMRGRNIMSTANKVHVQMNVHGDKKLTYIYWETDYKDQKSITFYEMSGNVIGVNCCSSLKDKEHILLNYRSGIDYAVWNSKWYITDVTHMQALRMFSGVFTSLMKESLNGWNAYRSGMATNMNDWYH